MGTIAMSSAVTRVRVDDEQRLYASILEIGVYLGLVVLLVTFALYVTGIVEPAVPIHALPEYWGLSAQQHLELINAQYLHREHALRREKAREALEQRAVIRQPLERSVRDDAVERRSGLPG